eukprot:364477-Chlamydomonas_euryale.AAC.2
MFGRNDILQICQRTFGLPEHAGHARGAGRAPATFHHKPGCHLGRPSKSTTASALLGCISAMSHNSLKSGLGP